MEHEEFRYRALRADDGEIEQCIRNRTNNTPQHGARPVERVPTDQKGVRS